MDNNRDKKQLEYMASIRKSLLTISKELEDISESLKLRNKADEKVQLYLLEQERKWEEKKNENN